MVRMLVLLALAALAGCGGRDEGGDVGRYPGATPRMLGMIDAASRRHGVPPDLVRGVVAQESGFDPGARNGPYLGLMQIHPTTARTMGYGGRPAGLFDPETNLEYGVRYLRGAWLVSGGNRNEAVDWYRRGYYYEAKRMGLLEETGLR
jgi:soluble lytic murein transglycosylase-like protein